MSFTFYCLVLVSCTSPLTLVDMGDYSRVWKTMFLLSLKAEEDQHNISSATTPPNVPQDISTEPSRFSAVSRSLSTEATSQMITEEPGTTDVFLRYFWCLLKQASITIIIISINVLFTHSLCSERALSVSIKGPVEATLPQNTVELNATVNPDDTSGTVWPSAFLNRNYTFNIMLTVAFSSEAPYAYEWTLVTSPDGHHGVMEGRHNKSVKISEVRLNSWPLSV